MKKTLLLILLTLFALNSYGQNKNLEYGIKGGLNYSSFVDNNDEDFPVDYKGKIGFHIGGFITFSISEKISLRPELLYSQQASEVTIKRPDGFFQTIMSFDGNIKESLLLLPIILEYKLSETFDLGIGPQFAYSINREVEFDINSEFNSLFITNDASEEFEVGIDFELGYSLADNYRISIRYIYAITERQNLNTSVLQLGLNYKL